MNVRRLVARLWSAPVRRPTRWRLDALEPRTLFHAHSPFGDFYTPPSAFVTNTSPLNAVAVPEADDPLDAAARYIARTPAFGLTLDDLADPIVTSRYADADAGLEHVYLRQRVNGLAVANADFSVALAPNGTTFSVGGGFVPGLAGRVDKEIAPALDPAAAVRAAAVALGLPAKDDVTLISKPDGVAWEAVVSAPSLSADDIPASLWYVPTADGGADLAWRLVLRTPDGDHWYEASVCAEDGELLALADWVDDAAAYNALAVPVESPQDGGFAVLANAEDPVASPYGWHDTNGVAGAEFTDTRGNNADVHLDRDNNNVADASPPRPDGGAALDFSRYAFDPALAATALPNQNVAQVSLFAYVNQLHDVHYKYGFTEAAGNFQANNYGRNPSGGTANAVAGNDAVQVDAQDGGDTNNANFATPADGTAPRMQQYIFVSTTPTRDSGLDNGIVAHEFGHGVSNRLTGGPANASALNNTQSGGMGEGWSDFYTLMFSQRPGDTPTARYPVGTYALGHSPTTGAGIRRRPYSFDMAIDPLTWEHYGTSGTVGGIARSTQVHNTGEIWCSALWDMNWLLVNKHGFDADLLTGWVAGTGPASAGNKLTLRLVMLAMTLQPANPSFTQARDAVLSADVALTGGANRPEIWTAFARRGLGAAAATTGSTATTVTTSFALPTDLAGLAVTGSSPAARATLTAGPGAYTLTLNYAVNPSDVDAADLTVDGVPATGVSYTEGATSVTFTFAADPGAAAGAHRMQVAAGALLNAFVGPVAPFAATFRTDPAALQLTSTAPADGAVVATPLTTLDLNLSEPVDPATVRPSDLRLSQGYATGVEFLNGNQTLRFALAGVTEEGTLSARVLAGTVADAAGNPNPVDLTAGYVLDSVSRPFAAPLAAVGAAGTQAYQGTTTGVVSTLAAGPDADEFTLPLDPGQAVGLTFTPAAALRGRLVVRDPAGATVADLSAVANGQALVVPPLTTAAGTYTLRVEGLANTLGGYAIRATLNAAGEAEPNNAAATAVSLAAVTRTTPTPAGVTRLATATGAADGLVPYAATAVTHAYEDISGNVGAGATRVLTGTGTGTDDATATIALPFAFAYYGTAYTSVFASTNGLLSFASATTAYDNTDLSASPTIPVIAAFWDDLFTSADGVIWQVLGAGTDRRLVVQWQNVRFLGGSSNTLRFQIALFEGSNAIEFRYANLTAGVAGSNEGGSATVGLKNANAAAGGASPLLLSQNGTANPLIGSGKTVRIAPAAPPPDVYAVPAAAGETLSVALSALGAANVDVRLLGTDGTTVLATGAAGATNLNEAIQNVAVPATGTYYLSVTGAAGAAYAVTALANAAFDAEANDTAAAAQPIAGGAYGAVASGTDEDWFTVNLGGADEAVWVETRTPGDGPGEFRNALDPLVRVYDAAGATLLGTGASLADGRNEALVVPGLTPGGSYRVRVTGAASSVGEYVLTARTGPAALFTPAAPTVVVNTGLAQRSRVTSLTVTFDRAVNTAPLAQAGAFTLTRPADNLSIPLTVVLSADGFGRTVAALTFSGSDLQFGSLPDGRWTLGLPAGVVQGVGSGTAGAIADATSVFRLYGDANGDAGVNGTDYGVFRLTFGQEVGDANYRDFMDFNQDGAVNGTDYAQFRTRFGSELP